MTALVKSKPLLFTFVSEEGWLSMASPSLHSLAVMWGGEGKIAPLTRLLLATQQYSQGRLILTQPLLLSQSFTRKCFSL